MLKVYLPLTEVNNTEQYKLLSLLSS